MIVVAGLAAVGIVFFVLVWLIWYFSAIGDLEYTKMKFKNFKTIYYIAPEKWSLFDFYDLPRYKKNGDYYAQETIGFGAVDFLRWIVFRRRQRKKSERARAAKTETELLKMFKQDIEKYKTSAADFVNKEIEKLTREKK